MSEDEKQQIKVIHNLIRVVEWTAMLPLNLSEHDMAITIGKGVVSLPMASHEKLFDLDVATTNQRVGMTDEEKKDLGIDVPHSLYVFRAVIGSAIPEGRDVSKYVTDQPDAEKVQEIFNKQRQAAQAGAELKLPRGVRGGKKR